MDWPGAPCLAPAVTFSRQHRPMRRQSRQIAAAESVSFTVAPGEIPCVVGESDSGESVTAVMGLLERGCGRPG